MTAFKFVIVALLIFIVGSLFSGLYFLIRDPSDSRRVLRALSLRIILSLVAIILLVVSIKLGWIVPKVVGQ